MVAPRPRSIVRRDRLFFVITMKHSLLTGLTGVERRSFLARVATLRRSHLKGATVHNSQNQRRPAVVAGSRLSYDRAEGRHIVVRNRPAEGIGQELFRERADEFVAVRHQRLPELVWAPKPRSVGKHARRVDGRVSF